MVPNAPAPRTDFDWAVYRDATLAGLSVLVPVPLLDLAFEWFFRRRIPQAIARRRGRRLEPFVTQALNRSRTGCRQSCLLWPFTLVYIFLKRLSRKILYFLTVKEATDQLSHYWHRAFLLDYALVQGHLDDVESAELAATALEQVLNDITTSPLNQLARQIIAGTSHVWRTLRGARRDQEDEVITETRSRMARTWDNFGDYFEQVGAVYNQNYLDLKLRQQIQITPDDHAAHS